MKTSQHGGRPILTQTQNNTTLWIGHLHSDPNGRSAGQTFQCPSEGLLNNIQVYSTAVSQEGEVTLSLHEFDTASKTWGPAIAENHLTVEKGDQAHWISFSLQPVQLGKDIVYGFRLKSENALIGIGEAATHALQPFSGHEWSSRSPQEQGNYYQYFSLAFKVMCA